MGGRTIRRRHIAVLALLASLTGGLAAAQDVSVKTAKPAADVDVGWHVINTQEGLLITFATLV